jgi:hypothetical protein
MAARRLVDRLRIGRKLVPEAVEIDALAPLHQTLDIRSAEIEMPQRRASDDLIPRPDARKRSIHGDPSADAIRVLGSEGVADHVADVVSHEIDFVDLELVEDKRDVGALRFLIIAGTRMRREPHSAQIRHHDGVIAHELRRERGPHVSGVAEAVQHDDARASAANPDMNRCAVGLDVLTAH